MADLQTLEQWEASGAERYVFPKRNKVRYYMDFRMWEGVPSDRIFYRRESSPPDNKDDVWLVAAGFGIRGNYGNGSIAVSLKDMPPASPS